jgi:hypothetical protein
MSCNTSLVLKDAEHSGREDDKENAKTHTLMEIKRALKIYLLVGLS